MPPNAVAAARGAGAIDAATLQPVEQLVLTALDLVAQLSACPLSDANSMGPPSVGSVALPSMETACGFFIACLDLPQSLL